MRQERLGDRAAAQHAPPHAAAHPGQAKPALRATLLAASLALAGCVSETPADQTGLTLQGVEGGVRVAQAGDDRSLSFGMGRDRALRAIRQIVGVAPRRIPCAAEGRDAYITPQGMVTVYEDDVLVGWRKVSRTEGARCRA